MSLTPQVTDKYQKSTDKNQQAPDKYQQVQVYTITLTYMFKKQKVFIPKPAQTCNFCVSFTLGLYLLNILNELHSIIYYSLRGSC